ncbi:MAG: hypothetical protein K8R54_06825 [Bacteroidales bacterium]|nr:hypothetical protein [Bacteroidales bacterium]
MVSFLEKKLFEKTESQQNEILYAQWKYDKELIPTALQAISNLFPHYSLHDESHSKSILNNIFRIIGEDKIEKLSAIDIWLLLEASYLHDIGMVVSGNNISKALNSLDFLNYFKELQNDKSNYLLSFTRLLMTTCF